ncbi:hypothetical protein PYK79_41990 [Streptomyces sp. ID05-04B]|uniref:hypothetical protein n=1 Tax=unclassified Streptomyces TaxID=2593676 RepID=UPI000D1A6728|nr:MULTISPECIES: hypothetical protein [unclassified Streptomyces]AVV42994.1 hypothetical protein C6376_17830 [Streptomyces sp. P3]MDX5568576.1 hypothetical protein [Streptomyces sp. ID05-04B]
MRIRSVLAATTLGFALAAVGATTATADAGPREHHHFGEVKGVCSPYVGAIDTVSADIFWAGKHCDRF